MHCKNNILKGKNSITWGFVFLITFKRVDKHPSAFLSPQCRNSGGPAMGQHPNSPRPEYQCSPRWADGLPEPLQPHPTTPLVRNQHPQVRPEPTGADTQLHDAGEPYPSSPPKRAAESEGVCFTGSPCQLLAEGIPTLISKLILHFSSFLLAGRLRCMVQSHSPLLAASPKAGQHQEKQGKRKLF